MKSKKSNLVQRFASHSSRGRTPLFRADRSESECGCLALLSRRWARRPSALKSPNDIISTGSRWRGESLQWLRANGPDVRATWPAPGVRMLPLTEPVMQSRGSALCCSPLLRHQSDCAHHGDTLFCNFLAHPYAKSPVAFKAMLFVIIVLFFLLS